MKEPILPWMRERAKFNHGWVSNHYLNVLDVLREGLLFRSGEPDWDTMLVELEEWSSQSRVAWSLIERFESEMATSRIFQVIAQPPGNSELRASLDEILDSLWENNPNTKQVVISARLAVQKADEVFSEMKEAIARRSLRELDRDLVNKALKVFRNVVTAFEKFRDTSRYRINQCPTVGSGGG
jgi:hypothetical protein